MGDMNSYEHLRIAGEHSVSSGIHADMRIPRGIAAGR
jgi:hypothetical protein